MTEKIQKILAGHGLGSRREIEQWLRDGRISVNGKTAILGERTTQDAQIRIDGRPVRLQPEKTMKSRVLVYNKPEGEICSRHDPEGRPSVFDRLPLLRNGRWVSIGRLDFNTSGLLLFTNDGALAHRLMHPSSNIDREYAVRVQGQVTAATLAILKKGVVLEDGSAHFSSISDQGGEGSNHWYHVTVGQGKNRIVRRLFESQGLMVSRLIRIRFGNLLLPRILRRGKWDEMTPAQIAQLFQPAVPKKSPVKQHEKNDRGEKRPHTGKKAGHRERFSSPPKKPRAFRSAGKKPSDWKQSDGRRPSSARDAERPFSDRKKPTGRPPHRSAAPASRGEKDKNNRSSRPRNAADSHSREQRAPRPRNAADGRSREERSTRPRNAADSRSREQRSTRPRNAADSRSREQRAPRPRNAADGRALTPSEKSFSGHSTRNKIISWRKYPDAAPAQPFSRPKQRPMGKRPASTHAAQRPGQVASRAQRTRAPHQTQNRPVLSRRKKPE